MKPGTKAGPCKRPGRRVRTSEHIRLHAFQDVGQTSMRFTLTVEAAADNTSPSDFVICLQFTLPVARRLSQDAASLP